MSSDKDFVVEPSKACAEARANDAAGRGTARFSSRLIWDVSELAVRRLIDGTHADAW